MTVIEELTEAKEYLAKHGLCQDGSFGTIDGPCCASGALGQVVYQRPSCGPDAFAFFYLTEAFDHSIHKDRRYLTLWNDEPTTTLQDVLDLYDVAIKIAEEDE